MTAGLSSLVFAADVLLVAWTAWLATCAAGLHRRGLVEGLLAWLLLALAWVASSGVVLGLSGELGRIGFLVIHSAGLAGLLAARRRWREEVRAWLEWLGGWWRLGREGTPEGWLAAALAVVMGGLALLAAQAEPIVYDALTYRLSRIGAWLQDGWIRHYATDDPRLNYMPVAPDVVIAWLLGATDEGFALAPLAQTAAAVLLMGATFGLARLAGLTRLSALGAVALLLGMANVAVQFTTIQSDLFTAGVTAAAYFLWHRALQRGEGSWVAGLGAALAFGSKGTVFYLAPGAALWVLWLGWRHRQHWRALGPTAAGLVGGALVLVVPGYWSNHATYGSIFGPRDAVVLHHGAFASPAHYPEKAMRNLGTSAVQMFEPTAQPFWLQGFSQGVGARLAANASALPDPYVFMAESRREQLERVMKLTRPDADVVTFGLLGTGCFFAGLALAAARIRRSAAAPQVLVWGGGVLLYMVIQHALVQWHVWSFRFMVLAAPWVAVAGAWGVDHLPRKLRVGVWTLLVISAVQVFVLIQAQTGQAAWQAAHHSDRSASYFYYRHWRGWVERLDSPELPLRAVLPINSTLSAFYRLAPLRQVELEKLSGLEAATAEAAVAAKPGWLLVPLEQFIGREGRVMGRTDLLNLAAFRALHPGEHPRPLLYAHQLIDQEATIRRELLVRTWSDAPVRLEVFNPGVADCAFKVRTPTGQVAGLVPAGSRMVVKVPVPADVLAVVTVDFPKLKGVADQPVPLVQLEP